MCITFIVRLSCVLVDFQHVVWRVSPGTQRGITTGLIDYRCFTTYTHNYIIMNTWSEDMNHILHKTFYSYGTD